MCMSKFLVHSYKKKLLPHEYVYPFIGLCLSHLFLFVMLTVIFFIVQDASLSSQPFSAILPRPVDYSHLQSLVGTSRQDSGASHIVGAKIIRCR